MSTAQEVKRRVTEKMDHAIEHLKRDLAGIRTGRASVALPVASKSTITAR